MAKAAKEIKENALAVVGFTPPAIMDEDFSSIMAEEMDGLTLDFTRVKIPSGGGLMFEIPGDDPDNPESVKVLEGVIVDHYPCNALWVEEFRGGNAPPDCSSLDGKVGIARDGKQRACATCKYNQWGSDTKGGNGKRCKNMRRMYVLQEGVPFPLLLTVPPTSLKNVADYVAKRVLVKKLRLSEVVTSITLRKATSNDGIVYSQVFFKLAGVLPPETRASMKKFSASIKPITRKMALEANDYVISEDEDGDIIEVAEAPDPRAMPKDAPYDIPGTHKKRTPKAKVSGGEDDPYFGTEPPF